MVIRQKKQKNCLPEEQMSGDCWIGLSLANDSGLILAARVGKHTDIFIGELVSSTEGTTDCLNWKTDGWAVMRECWQSTSIMKSERRILSD